MRFLVWKYAMRIAEGAKPGSTGCQTLAVDYKMFSINPLNPDGKTAMSEPLLQSNVAGYPCRRGKVRDVYDLGDRLVIVATDRISAFDWVLPTGIPDKGRILTSLTLFWLKFLGGSHHLLGTDLREMGPEFAA